MRLPWKHSVLLTWRTPAWLCVAIILLTCRMAISAQYAAGTPITDVSITNPTEDEVWLAGSNHTLTCTTSTDTDRRCITKWEDVSDSVTHYWEGTGTFKDNDNIGTSVTYICTNAAGNNNVKVYANDDYAPANNTAIVNESPKSDSETISVVVPTLEWVEFGGTNKHTLYKKDANPWNPGNENYASNYTTAVPNKAWVRDPALTDPVCYTKGSNGAQVTTSINFASISITEESTVNIEGVTDAFHPFASNGINVSGEETTVPAMNTDVAFADVVKGTPWSITWSYKVPTGSNTWIAIGTSQNPCYTTWGTPDGSTVTAKRMNWAAYVRSGNATTVTQLGQNIGDGWNADTIFGQNNFSNYWEPLDKGVHKNDCLAASVGTVTALKLLGVPAADTGTQKSWASSDDQRPNPNYNSDVTDEEIQGGLKLWYTDNAENPAWPWNRFEGNYKVKDGTTWKYWAVFGRMGPKIGTGANDAEKDKSARYQILDAARNAAGANFWQKWGGVGAKITLY